MQSTKSGNISKFFLLISMAVVLVFPGLSTASESDRCDNQKVINFLPPDVSGSVNLCVVSKGVRANVRAADLIPGNAYTVWWIYFDDPSQCGLPGVCGADPTDFLGENPISVLGRLGSTVAGEGGIAMIRGDWGGMVPTSGSEIQLFLLDHGPADYTDGRHLARQTLTPEDPFFGVPHHGNLVDGWRGIPVGFTVHSMD